MFSSAEQLGFLALGLLGLLMLLHVAHASGRGTLDFDGNVIVREERPKAFRTAMCVETGLAILLILSAAARLVWP
ncbi:MAG TPA: hypothetical protein VEZ20_06515 [Allosphingosinicella sp.]|nr:hypothetical protein [Allosphingosinicella sp.]